MGHKFNIDVGNDSLDKLNFVFVKSNWKKAKHTSHYEYYSLLRKDNDVGC